MPKGTKRHPREPVKRTIRLRGERAPKFGKTSSSSGSTDSAGSLGQAKSMRGEALLRKANRAVIRAGIKERTVFRDAKTGVFAYSVDPRDPQRIVRLSADGKKTMGHFADGRFRAG